MIFVFCLPRLGSRGRWTALAAASAAALGSIPLPASALSWNWSYERPADSSGPAVQALGQLTTTDAPDANGFYTITAVAGQRNSVMITSFLPTGVAIPGNCSSVSSCYDSDNIVRLLGSGEGQLTTHGFGVGLADGTYANYFFADFLQPKVYLEYYSAPPFSVLPPGPEDSELAGLFQAEPVPGPLPIAGTLFGWGWGRKMRQRQRAAQDRNLQMGAPGVPRRM